ncbi:MAG: response regulator [Thermodesulfovibrionales bacterium]|nr:response regulator [Thermodesulfovibrionales bacterium]
MKKKIKILIADDAVDTVELLKKRFHSEGYDTAEAYNGEEALKQVAECNPDLIVLDIMMPKIDGYEVCQRLKADENTRYIPVLMLTAKGEVENKVKGLDIGADDYLAKPFDYKELSARVRSLLTIKAAREKLVEEEKAEALEKMMEEVTHEIRNPLTSIGGFARRVYEKLPEGDSNKKYMEMIIDDVARLENMIKQLVELKTIAISYREPTNINDVIMEALKLFEKEFEDKGIEVKTKLVDNPPLIPVDKEQMKVAISNLIRNSIEAMQERLKILKLTSQISDGRMEIQVSDTGKGIPKDKIKHIFDPFFTSKIYGPGLGLTFTLKIVQQHRGTISVESEPGKGTTFTIRLPLKKS